MGSALDVIVVEANETAGVPVIVAETEGVPVIVAETEPLTGTEESAIVTLNEFATDLAPSALVMYATATWSLVVRARVLTEPVIVVDARVTAGVPVIETLPETGWVTPEPSTASLLLTSALGS